MKSINFGRVILAAAILVTGPLFAQESDDDDIIGCAAIGTGVGIVTYEVLSDQTADTLGERIATGIVSTIVGWATNEVCENMDAAAEEAFQDVAYAWGVSIIPLDPSLPGYNGVPWCMHVDQNACDPFQNDNDTFQNLLDAWSIIGDGIDNLRFGGADTSFGVFTSNSFTSAFESAALNYEVQSGFMSTTSSTTDSL